MRKQRLIGSLMMLSGCAKALPAPASPVEEEHYRPSWTANLVVHTDAAHACLEGREEPRFVAFVEPLSTGAVGITTVDAYGAVEHCAYHDGRVLRRESASVSAREFAGLPFFALGAEPPALPVGQVAEEVFEKDHVVGWLFWPAKQDGGGQP